MTGATEAVTPEDLMRKLISRAHAPWDMLEPALAIIREAEVNALRRAADKAAKLGDDFIADAIRSLIQT